MSSTPIAGLHHVTAISGPPQPNLDFYTGPMQQRLVKRTVNFDDPGTYHLYYGDRRGSPGTILTFFPFVGARQGRAGYGMASAFAYDLPAQAFDTVAQSLRQAGLAPTEAPERFGARVLHLADPDGQAVELVETDTPGEGIGGFHSVTLWLRDPAPTARILTEGFGYVEAGHETGKGSERLRFALPGDAPGRVVDLWRADDAPQAVQGAGTIHHVAFRAESDAHQDSLRAGLLRMGMQVTPRIDRNYFNAIYFREPGGVLFEVATDPPGFMVDEPEADLGKNLKLPPQYESRRAVIEAHLPPLRLPE